MKVFKRIKKELALALKRILSEETIYKSHSLICVNFRLRFRLTPHRGSFGEQARLEFN